MLISRIGFALLLLVGQASARGSENECAYGSHFIGSPSSWLLAQGERILPKLARLMMMMLAERSRLLLSANCLFGAAQVVPAATYIPQLVCGG
jgi:hypothetical protein